MGIQATFSSFMHMHMLHGSYPQRRRPMAHETLDLIPARILLDTGKLEQELQVFYQELQPEDVRSMLKDSMCNQVSMLTNDAFGNTKLLRQIPLEQLDLKEGFAYFVYAVAAVKSLFYLRLEKSIGDLKRPYFQNEVPVVDVRCVRSLEGVGNKTLALALCNDLNIKGCFQILLFIALSESPYVQGLIEMMWDGIVVRNRSEFQNVEDACMQLQIQLPRQSQPTPLISKDDGSRENMEKLLFQVAGYKNLLTTRDNSIIPRNHPTQFYQLPLLGQDDALSLFCFHGEPCEAWQSPKTKLSKAELVSDYHIDGLLRFFLTGARFPVDKKICPDALFHIWAYVRKLEWLEAFTILLKLASRNLLNLISKLRSTTATFYGNSSELYFYGYYVMQDLALYLGGQGIAFRRNRLLGAQEGGYFAREIQVQKARPFDAQIASIHTG